MFSYGHTSLDLPLESYREFDLRQAEFFMFLDKELEKIEKFYRSKEIEGMARLEALKGQLHEMRNRRLEEVMVEPNGGWTRPIENVIGLGEDRTDFSRRQVPYRAAKRKLKLALQEFYRGLELLKSYALLNRTAFRKINKKYDKAVQARPTGRYMSEKVNHAWFVQSEALDAQLVAVEDLYARYFERGNHRIAVNKLRTKHVKESYTASVFRNGLLLAAGTVLCIQGVVYGSRIETVQASFLLQVWSSPEVSRLTWPDLCRIFPRSGLVPLVLPRLQDMGRLQDQLRLHLRV